MAHIRYFAHQHRLTLGDAPEVARDLLTVDVPVDGTLLQQLLDDDGEVKHHLVLIGARPDVDLNWAAATEWATKLGGTLPTRQEQALLFANCKAVLPQRWCWSSETEGSSYAWICSFGYGSQSYNDRSYEGCAVAVRRLNP